MPRRRWLGCRVVCAEQPAAWTALAVGCNCFFFLRVCTRSLDSQPRLTLLCLVSAQPHRNEEAGVFRFRAGQDGKGSEDPQPPCRRLKSRGAHRQQGPNQAETVRGTHPPGQVSTAPRTGHVAQFLAPACLPESAAAAACLHRNTHARFLGCSAPLGGPCAPEAAKTFAPQSQPHPHPAVVEAADDATEQQDGFPEDLYGEAFEQEDDDEHDEDDDHNADAFETNHSATRPPQKRISPSYSSGHRTPVVAAADEDLAADAAPSAEVSNPALSAHALSAFG